MSDEFLQIQFASHPPRAGGTLQGEVLLRPKHNQPCQGINLALSWCTSGTGKCNGTQVLSTKLKGPATLKAGQTYHLPFRLKLPLAPLSYQGKLFKLNWDLQATVLGSRPSATPRVTEPFTLLPAKNPSGLGSGKFRPIGYSLLWGQHGERVISFVAGLLQLGSGSLLIHTGLVTSAVGSWREKPDELFWLALVIVLFALSLHSFWKALRQTLAQSLLRVQVEPIERAHTGHPLHCQVRLRPRFPLTLKFLNIQLKSQERCSYTTVGWGPDGLTRFLHIKEHELFEYTHCPVDDHHLERCQTESYQASLSLPDDAAPTILTQNNQLLWLLNITIKPWLLPRWKQEFVVDVYAR